MCLNLRKTHNKRYNSNNIRWKIALINPCQDEGLPLKQLVSYYRGYMYDLGKWIKAFNRNDIKQYNKEAGEVQHVFQNWRRMFGYHVFLDRAGARRKIIKEHPKLFSLQNVLMKVEVKEFIASGYFNKTKSETYKYMRIIEVFNCKGESIWRIRYKDK